MGKFFIRRLFWVFPTLIGISMLVFWMMHQIPGSPWDKSGRQPALLFGPSDTTSQDVLNERYGLDKPLWQQYLFYMFTYPDKDGKLHCGAICGNLGPSYRQVGSSINEGLFKAPEGKSPWDSRFGYTMRLVGISLLMIVLVGIPLGVMAALYQNSWVDNLVTNVLAIGIAIPNFVMGLVLIIVLGTWLHVIKIVTSDWSDLRAWIVPAVVLALNPLSALARLTRTAVLDVMGADYVRVARSKGLRERRVVWGHIFRNALIPIITFLGPTIAELLAGSFIVETLFSFPGFGREFWESVTRVDYSMIMAATLIYALFIALANLVVDLFYGVIDPRISVE